MRRCCVVPSHLCSVSRFVLYWWWFNLLRFWSDQSILYPHFLGRGCEYHFPLWQPVGGGWKGLAAGCCSILPQIVRGSIFRGGRGSSFLDIGRPQQVHPRYILDLLEVSFDVVHTGDRSERIGFYLGYHIRDGLTA